MEKVGRLRICQVKCLKGEQEEFAFDTEGYWKPVELLENASDVTKGWGSGDDGGPLSSGPEGV